MIATHPDYINGDNLSFKQHLAAALNAKRIVYSTLWNWLKKTTAYSSIPMLIADLALFVALVYQDWKDGGDSNWLLIFSMLSIIFIVFLPLVWVVTYRYSFVQPKKVSEKFTDFIENHIPGATHVRGLSYTNYILHWKDFEYELAYSFIPGMNAKGKVVAHYPCFILCLHIFPHPDHSSDILDEDGLYLPSFLDQVYGYCEGKESLRTLRIEHDSMYSFFRVQDLKDNNLVTNAMEQMQYITTRFNLVPLYMRNMFDIEIKNWLRINDQATSDDIVAFNVDILETEEGYLLSLSGSKTYEANNATWTSNEDFMAEEKCLDMAMTNHTSDDWSDFQLLAKNSVRKYVESIAEDEQSIFYQKVVTVRVGKDGDLEVVSNGK